MHSKLMLLSVCSMAAIAVVWAEPPVDTYGPPGYTAPRVISTGNSGSIGRGSGISSTINSGFSRGSGSSISSTINSGSSISSSGSSGPSNTGSRNIGVFNGPSYSGQEGGEPEPFNYAYEVKDSPSGNDFGSIANSDGKRVQGEYRVLLPDGRRQIVKYTADDGGYNADVQYEGQARYPDPKPYNGPLAIPNSPVNTITPINTNSGSNFVSTKTVSSYTPSKTTTTTFVPKITTVSRTISPIVVAPAAPVSSSPKFSGYRY